MEPIENVSCIKNSITRLVSMHPGPSLHIQNTWAPGWEKRMEKYVTIDIIKKETRNGTELKVLDIK